MSPTHSSSAREPYGVARVCRAREVPRSAFDDSVGKVCPARGVMAAVGLGGSADGGLKGPRAAIKLLRGAGWA